MAAANSSRKNKVHQEVLAVSPWTIDEDEIYPVALLASPKAKASQPTAWVEAILDDLESRTMVR